MPWRRAIASVAFRWQDVLESGYPGPGHTESGWLNRAIFALPGSETSRLRGLGVGATAPLVIRGRAPVLGWAPQILPAASDDLAMRVLDLYQHRDSALARLYALVSKPARWRRAAVSPAT